MGKLGELTNYEFSICPDSGSDSPIDQLGELYVRMGDMEGNRSPSFKTVLPLALILGLPGWIGLIYLMTQTIPDLGNRWLFFITLEFAITGAALPIVAYLNRVATPFGPATFEIVVRESTMVGIYLGVLLWLNKGQVLSFGLAIILAVGLILIELLLRLRYRSEWHPNS